MCKTYFTLRFADAYTYVLMAHINKSGLNNVIDKLLSYQGTLIFRFISGVIVIMNRTGSPRVVRLIA